MIRHLDDDVEIHLKRQAARHGWSMEKEARGILRNVLTKGNDVPAKLGSRIAARFAEVGLDEALPEIRGRKALPIDLAT